MNRTVTIKFHSKGNHYTFTFPWITPEKFAEDVKNTYQKLGVKKATCQMHKISNWSFWAGYII